MRATRQHNTAAEQAVQGELDGLGLEYVTDAAPIDALRRRADFLFLGPRVAVYIDGCFWHGCAVHGTWPKANAEFWREKIETNRRRDADTDRRLAQAGWLVKRFWEHEDPKAAAAAIARVVRRRSNR